MGCVLLTLRLRGGLLPGRDASPLVDGKLISIQVDRYMVVRVLYMVVGVLYSKVEVKCVSGWRVNIDVYGTNLALKRARSKTMLSLWARAAQGESIT